MLLSFRNLLYFSGVILLWSCSDNQPSSHTKKEDSNPKEMRIISDYTIAFYNVENLFDTFDDPLTSDDDFTPNGEKNWTEERYQTKLEHISNVLIGIDKNAPLLTGLCEVENKKVLTDLINEPKLKKASYSFIHYNSPDTRGIDVALLYNTTYFEVLEHESLEVTFKNHPNVLTRDILYVKGLLNGEIIHLFVNHWSSRRKGEKETEYKRIEAARVLKTKVDAILATDKKAKILIMGDFNDYPNNKSLTNILEASLQPKADEFYNLASKLDRADKGSHFYNDEWGMLDQMMVSNAWLSAKKGNVLAKKTVEIYKGGEVLYEHNKLGKIPSKTYGGNRYYGGYSDHLAIFLRLKYKP